MNSFSNESRNIWWNGRVEIRPCARRGEVLEEFRSKFPGITGKSSWNEMKTNKISQFGILQVFLWYLEATKQMETVTADDYLPKLEKSTNTQASLFALPNFASIWWSENCLFSFAAYVVTYNVITLPVEGSDNEWRQEKVEYY